MERRRLTLKPKVDPATKPKVDPTKVALSEKLGFRFVDRGGRYIMQKLYVTYWQLPPNQHQGTEDSRTWVDVPLVPETYIG